MNKKNVDTEPIRLNRYLAMLGVGSRRACDDLIASGRVRVDKRRVDTIGVKIVPGVNTVHIDRIPLENPPRPVVLLLNKPLGVVSTVSDPQGRPTVLDLCKRFARNKRLFPVGRLDINTTGAILLTNDGKLCYRLTHPRYEIPRVYIVRVRGLVDERKLKRLDKMTAPPGRHAGRRPGAQLVRGLERESILKITLHEGRHRQVRRMCQVVGLRVVQLRRVQFGPITIRKLPLGAVRPLEKNELEKLKRLAS
ncbi:MAG: rRNA pseudouridine synthase [Candidatus Latescibacterota bacterium]|nr:MAG: rRNA pseudouridine synthase [Candidatus Latescibacterota bacterium]